jgi:hypothetical protein
MKIVINRAFGGFGLSEEAQREMGWSSPYGPFGEVKRDDPKLVEVVERLGERANGDHAKLAIVEVTHKHWQIEEYDGLEKVIASRSPLVTY